MAYLSKEVEQAHVVWFEASNQWAQFDEQQWLIFCFYNQRVSQEEAVNELCRRFSFQIQEAQAFVESIYFSLHNLFNPPFETPNFTVDAEEVVSYTLKKSKTHLYAFNGKIFRIVYGSPSLESYIHSPLAHLEIKGEHANILEIDIFPFKEHYALRVKDGQVKGLTAQEQGQIKRLLYIELASCFYGLDENQWLTFIHGSALKRNNEVLVVTSPGGSGKSTLAGILQMNGFSFFSDDFIPVDTKGKKVFPFPAALCLKNKSIEVLGGMGQEFDHISTNSIAYVKHKKPLEISPCNVRRMVFVQYKEGFEAKLEKVSTLKALYDFLQEAWVGDDMQRAEEFIHWFTSLSFYRLTYGNSSLAVKTLKNLMDGNE